MAITKRDLEVIRYAEKGFLINADIASRLIYWTKNETSSLNIAQRRLRELYRLKQIKRSREFIGQPYTYYLGKAPAKLNHRLMQTDLLSRMTQDGFKIDLNETEIEYKGLEEKYHIRPDLLVVFEYAGRKYQALVEIDITKTFSHAKEYTRLYKDLKEGRYKMRYPVCLVSVCDTKPDIGCVWIKTDWSNFSNLKYTFIDR